ncbi:hypothetical protein [Nocardia puris]|uniref:hypothetical protein n=1 Tax=Nocardia puris TaxID=208602 RepID=UPI002E1D3860
MSALLDAIAHHETLPDTDYTPTRHPGAVATVIYTYGSETGPYTYVEHYRDMEYAEVSYEEDRGSARDNRRRAEKRTPAEMFEEHGGDWITEVKLKRWI